MHRQHRRSTPHSTKSIISVIITVHHVLHSRAALSRFVSACSSASLFASSFTSLSYRRLAAAMAMLHVQGKAVQGATCCDAVCERGQFDTF